MRLDRHSEKFSADGNLSAEGFEKLLGKPSLQMLAVLMREAIQNSCDATSEDPGLAQVRVRVRTLTERQCEVLASEVFGELPEEETAAKYLSDVLDTSEPLQVLEIADYGTSGLSGPTRADIPPIGNERADFVNFFRNIGAARDVEGGGGTYGYGKATLYRASRAHAILVDTLTTQGGNPVRRIMAAQMGKSVPGSVTGRHWWGTDSEDGKTVDPLIGDEADRLAEKLGLPERAEENQDFGTTIMILAPHLPSNSQYVVGAMTEYLLWNFWPRMMGSTPRGKKLEAFVAENEHEWTKVPSPETFPPFDVLCRAMTALRTGKDEEVQVANINHGNFGTRLGQLAIARTKAGRRRWLLPPTVTEDDDAMVSIIPERLHHVALMRPAQLVVRYEKGNPSGGSEEEWGGVFVCSEAEEVEHAFANSEPPAHDDWQPQSLPLRSRERSYVNNALTQIRRSLIEQFAPEEPPADDGGPLAKSSTIMGRFLSGENGQGAGRTIGKGKGSKPSRPPAFAQPRPHALLADERGKPIAEFVFEVYAAGRGKHLRAIPAVAMEGSLQEPDEATGMPQVLSWSGPSGEEGNGADIKVTSTGSWQVKVSVPDDVAVGLRLREQGRAAE